MSETKTQPCPQCGGSGETGPMLACGPGTSVLIQKAICYVCRGEKSISAEQSERMALGKRVRAKRLELSIHQAGLAAYLGEDRIRFSKAESLGIGEARTFERMAEWLESGR
jgi:DnaJ-class molecular chaperone